MGNILRRVLHGISMASKWDNKNTNTGYSWDGFSFSFNTGKVSTHSSGDYSGEFDTSYKPAEGEVGAVEGNDIILKEVIIEEKMNSKARRAERRAAEREGKEKESDLTDHPAYIKYLERELEKAKAAKGIDI